MVDEQIAGRGIADPTVLAALRGVRRHRFVPPAEAPRAYDDGPLPIGRGQTISQPYVVAFMTQAARLGRHCVLVDQSPEAVAVMTERLAFARPRVTTVIGG